MSETITVFTRLTWWQRIKLFFCPPEAIQASAYSQPWQGVTTEWLERVEERFAHQEARAAAMKRLEEASAQLRGEGAPAVVWKDRGVESIARYASGVDQCAHNERIAEHVQMCANCGRILKHDERVMVLPEEYRALVHMRQQWEEIALYLRLNFQREIERGDHANRTDADVIIGYLSRVHGDVHQVR